MTNQPATPVPDIGPRLIPPIAGASGYSPPTLPGPIDLRLDANEGPGMAGLDPSKAFAIEQLRRYPSSRALEHDLAARHGVTPEQVLVTAGGDEAIDRLCRVCLDRDRSAVVPVPTFEMIARSARLPGARVIEVPWTGDAFPRQAVCDAVDPATGLVAIVTPNNPTGAIATLEDIAAVAAAAPRAVVPVDLAYVEFADVDPTRAVLAMLNTVVTRTFSKAAGLAGLRVGVVDGGRAGHTLVPVTTAGCYVPGGRLPLVSSAIMTIATARAAGVERVVAASPRPTVETLAAAAIAGADALLAMGGAQAIGALAKGLCRMPHCDVIVGPGNQSVTAAKFLVSAQVGIDMLAGPSELLIVADSTADPALIAADLLAQAEHDVDARACLIVQTPELIEAVGREIRVQLARLPLADTARVALERSFVVAVRDREAACALIDALAPEHLELMTSDAADLARTWRNAGAIFLGSWSPEAIGDYGIGPNHVLPTGGTSRARGGLSVLTFLRARTWLHLERPGGEAWLDAVNLARIERLEAHARSIEARLVNVANFKWTIVAHNYRKNVAVRA